MKNDEDLQLFKNVYEWLEPGGKFIVDCPIAEAQSGTWTKSFQIDPSFKDRTGHVFGLMDPIRDNLTGLSRYYYPKEEIAKMLASIGFKVAEASPHYYPQNYFALVGTK